MTSDVNAKPRAATPALMPSALIRFSIPKWLLSVFFAGSVVTHAEGIPEPGVIFYGTVTNNLDGTNVRMTRGEVVWTFKRVLGGDPVSVRSSIQPVGSEFLYVVEVPFETVQSGMLDSPEKLNLPEGTPEAFDRAEVRVNGVLAGIVSKSGPAQSFLMGPAGRGNQERLDLTSQLVLVDSDGDGLPDEWELQHFGDLRFGPTDDPDGDGQSNLRELNGGSSPVDQVSVPAGLEGDVAPRPAGSGTLSIADWVQVGRFAAGLDTPTSVDEFLRGDCSPLLTKGNGSLSISDWVQAGRFAAGLDSPTTAGGPSGPPQQLSLRLARSSAAQVRMALGQARRHEDGKVEFPLRLDSSVIVSGLGFSVGFDPSRLKFAGIRSSHGGLSILINEFELNRGKLGCAVARNPDKSEPGFEGELLNLVFVETSAGATPELTWEDGPVGLEAVDHLAKELSVGRVAESSQRTIGAAGSNVGRSIDGYSTGAVQISWAAKANQTYRLMHCRDLLLQGEGWREIQRVRVSGTRGFLELKEPDQSQGFFRLDLVP